ncbi:MAG: CHASE3 domain-containing protein, partial [Cyanobacteriota bacterium]
MVSTAPQILFRRRLISVIILPLLLMLLLAGVSIWQINRLLLAMKWVEHTDQVIAQANRVQRLVTEVESGIRGHLLTDDPAFLVPYRQSEILVEPSFQALITLVSDNPPQVQRLVQIRSQYHEWSKYTPSLIAPKRKGEVASTAIIKTRHQLMNALRSQMSEFIETEERLRDARNQTVRRTTQVVISSSIALAALLGTILAYFIWRQIQSVSRSYEQALSVAQEQTESAQYSAQRLAALHEIDQAILAVQSIESLAHETLLKLKGIIAFEQGAVILFNFNTNEAQILAGRVAGDTAGAVVPITKQISSDLLEHCQPICYIKDIAALVHRPPALETLLDENYHSFLVVAILVEDNLIG